MKLMVASLVGMMALSGAAYAQSTSDSTGFVEGVAQSAFGNVTSQSFGIEGGISIAPKIDIVVDLGMVRDSSPKALGTAAQLVAAGLSNVQTSAVAFSVKQPIGFGMIGVQYDSTQRQDPPVCGSDRRHGSDQEGRALHHRRHGCHGQPVEIRRGAGSDVAGTETKLMFGGGVGVVYNITPSFMFDAGYRFNRINSDPGTTVNRIGAGIGYRFWDAGNPAHPGALTLPVGAPFFFTISPSGAAAY